MFSWFSIMAAKKKNAFMDALAEISSASSSDSETDEGQPSNQPVAKKSKLTVTVDDLQKAGYKGGQSLLLHMKAPQQETKSDWQISDGKTHKLQEEDETYEVLIRGWDAAALNPIADGCLGRLLALGMQP